MTDIYCLAKKNIRITSLHSEVHSLCTEYRSPGTEVDFSVETTQENIEFEREKSARLDEYEGRPVRNLTDGYLETLAVYRQIAEQMPAYDTFLVHGSCIAVDGAAYLFTAKSGTGKSTHTRLWRELLPGRTIMVNDDKPLVRITDHNAVIYGTPWDGKHHLSANISVPLKAVCILERGENNHIEEISRRDAWPRLLLQIYRPTDKEVFQRTLTLIDRLAASVNLWRLQCNMDIEAARIAYNAMNGGNT